MPKQRFRLQYKFWLDVNNPQEQQLADQIEGLKQGRVFSQVVRDGIALIVDLWNGNIDVLLSLFPGIEEVFYKRFMDQKPTADYTLQEQLARLERLLLEQGNKPMAVSSGGPKPLAVIAPGKPIRDEDDDVIVPIKKAKSSGTSAQNFLNSAFSLVQ
jgi:hypothetical protein